MKNDNNTRESGPEYEILLIFSVFGIGAIIRSIILKLNIRLSYTVLVFILGSLIGWLGVKLEVFHFYENLSNIRTKILLFVFLPALVFKNAYSMDYHTFTRAFWQILVVAVPGFLATATLTATLMKFIINFNWNFETYLLFGVMATATYSHDLVALLKELGQSTHLCILLEGESLIGSGVAIVAFHLLLSLPALGDGLTVFLELLKCFIGSPLLGLVMGKLTSLCLSYLFNDPVANVTLTFVAAYLTFFLGQEFLSFSGVVSVVVLGVVLSGERANFSAEIDGLLTSFWDILTYLATTLVVVVVGIVIAEDLMFILVWRDLYIVLVMYILCTLTRFAMFVAFCPLISRLGYGLPWRDGLVAAWSGPRGALSLCLALIVLRTKDTESIGAEFVIFVSALMLLTLIINGSTVNKLMKMLGMRNISLEKKKNMNNAMRYLYTVRARSICMLKMDRFVADANWDLVEKSTTINHPYNLEYKEEEYDADGFSDCPECLREASGELTATETAEMSRAAKLRILKARRRAYWRQHERGLLPREAARALVGAVEVAGDRGDPVMTVEDLTSAWKQRGVWTKVRRRLLDMVPRRKRQFVGPPRERWKYCFYKIASSLWFEVFICFIILINSMSVITELSMNSATLQWLNITVKCINTVCSIVFVIELVVQVVAYGHKKYFTSLWNLLDSVLLVVSLVDLTMDYLAVFASYDKHSSVTAKITTSARLLKLLCLVKHCVALSASIPRLVVLLDSHINSRHALGYSMGTGFVCGEEDVAQVLPGSAVGSELQAKMAADRLAVSREMGRMQRDLPWVAVAVKTRRVTRSVLNAMQQAVQDMKDSGTLDEVESTRLLGAVDHRVKQLNARSAAAVEPCPPQTLIRQLPWLVGGGREAEYLLDCSELVSFSQGEAILTAGERPEALYLLVSGSVQQSYEPNPARLRLLLDSGVLPNVDYMSSIRYAEPHLEYIVSGNVVGEMGVLTNRPYAATVTCDTSVQAYRLSLEVMHAAFVMSGDDTRGLRARMWKAVAVRVATAVLAEHPAYRSWPVERIASYLERSSVQCLAGGRAFSMPSTAQDVLLIEGRAVDADTRVEYRAPTHVLRTARQLLLPDPIKATAGTGLSVETRLLVIPARDEDRAARGPSVEPAMCPKHSSHPQSDRNQLQQRKATHNSKRESENRVSDFPKLKESAVFYVQIKPNQDPFATTSIKSVSNINRRRKSLMILNEGDRGEKPMVRESGKKRRSSVFFLDASTPSSLPVADTLSLNAIALSNLVQHRSTMFLTKSNDDIASTSRKRRQNSISLIETSDIGLVKEDPLQVFSESKEGTSQDSADKKTYPQRLSKNADTRQKYLDRSTNVEKQENGPNDKYQARARLPEHDEESEHSSIEYASSLFWSNANARVLSRRTSFSEWDAEEMAEEEIAGSRRLSQRSTSNHLDWSSNEEAILSNRNIYMDGLNSNMTSAEDVSVPARAEEDGEEIELMTRSLDTYNESSVHSIASRSSLTLPVESVIDIVGNDEDKLTDNTVDRSKGNMYTILSCSSLQLPTASALDIRDIEKVKLTETTRTGKRIPASNISHPLAGPSKEGVEEGLVLKEDNPNRMLMRTQASSSHGSGVTEGRMMPRQLVRAHNRTETVTVEDDEEDDVPDKEVCNVM